MRLLSIRQPAMWWSVAAAIGVLAASSGAVYAQRAVTEQTSEFAFSNPKLTANAGELVHITINNTGQFPHTIAFDDAAGAVITAQPADNVAGGASGVMDVTFAKAGTFDFWCPVDGHRDRGMVGTITIAGAQAGAGRAGGLDPVATAGGLGLLGLLSLGAGVFRRRRASA